MEIKNRKLWIFAALMVLAVASFVFNFKKGSSQREAAAPAAPAYSGGTASQLNDLYLIERKKKRSDSPVWGRNPFLKETESSGAPASSWVLNGIVWEEKMPRAVINGRIVGVGSKIGNAAVVKIEPTRVLLKDGEKDIELKVGRAKNKKSVSKT